MADFNQNIELKSNFFLDSKKLSIIFWAVFDVMLFDYFQFLAYYVQFVASWSSQETPESPRAP